MDNWYWSSKRKLGVRVVYDLSATPFFLKGSGYAEGTYSWYRAIFRWWTQSNAVLSSCLVCQLLIMLLEMKCCFTGALGTYWKKMPKKGRRDKRWPFFCRQCFKQHWKLYTVITRRFMKAGKRKEFSSVFIAVCKIRPPQSSCMILSLALNALMKKVCSARSRLELFQNYDKMVNAYRAKNIINR